MKTIKYFLKKKNKFVMALIMFYDNKGTKTKKFIGVKLCSLLSHR